MAEKKDFRVQFGSRYLLSINEFKGNLYTHIRDTKIPLGEDKPRYVTLHSEGVLGLQKVLGQVVEKIRAFNGASTLPPDELSSSGAEEEKEVVVPKKRKRKPQVHGI